MPSKASREKHLKIAAELTPAKDIEYSPQDPDHEQVPKTAVGGMAQYVYSQSIYGELRHKLTQAGVSPLPAEPNWDELIIKQPKQRLAITRSKLKELEGIARTAGIY